MSAKIPHFSTSPVHPRNRDPYTTGSQFTAHEKGTVEIGKASDFDLAEAATNPKLSEGEKTAAIAEYARRYPSDPENLTRCALGGTVNGYHSSWSTSMWAQVHKTAIDVREAEIMSGDYVNIATDSNGIGGIDVHLNGTLRRFDTVLPGNYCGSGSEVTKHLPDQGFYKIHHRYAPVRWWLGKEAAETALRLLIEDGFPERE